MVSDFGRVKSLSFRNNQANFKRERIMNNSRKDNGYLYVTLRVGGVRHNKHIHRLVAEAFIDNPNNYTEVNHIDFNRENNNVSNLEWVDHGMNIRHSRDAGRMNSRKHCKTNTGERYISLRPSSGRYRLTIDQHELGTFKTLDEAVKRRDEILAEVDG